MVDALISHDELSTKSSFTIHEDNVLVYKDVFMEAGLLENMAQTAALGKGYEFAEKNEKPPLGFIGAVKNFIVHELPKIGDVLETLVIIKHQVMNASIIHAQVFCNQEEIACCELKIFINPETY
jgi:uncharacterized Fe-S cluster-containing protein